MGLQQDAQWEWTRAVEGDVLKCPRLEIQPRRTNLTRPATTGSCPQRWYALRFASPSPVWNVRRLDAPHATGRLDSTVEFTKSISGARPHPNLRCSDAIREQIAAP
jgi:hypothetical protein